VQEHYRIAVAHIDNGHFVTQDRDAPLVERKGCRDHDWASSSARCPVAAAVAVVHLSDELTGPRLDNFVAAAEARHAAGAPDGGAGGAVSQARTRWRLALDSSRAAGYLEQGLQGGQAGG